MIACGVLRRELERLSKEGISFTFLLQGLHLDPAAMGRPLQEAIDALERTELDRVVLAYGLCSNGVAGLCARTHPLVIPRSHDCLGLLWGDPRALEADRAREPGTYYLSRGWIEAGAAPLDKLATYRGRMGDEDAEWGVREEFRHYTRLVWIETGQDPDGLFRQAARANAEFLGLAFESVQGQGEFLRRLVTEPAFDGCIVVPPGERLLSGQFY